MTLWGTPRVFILQISENQSLIRANPWPKNLLPQQMQVRHHNTAGHRADDADPALVGAADDDDSLWGAANLSRAELTYE